MKKFSLVCIVLLLTSMVTHGQESGWRENGSYVTLRQANDNVGIGVTDPRNRLEIKDAFYFHKGGHLVMGMGWRPGYGGDLNSDYYSSEVRLDQTNGIMILGVTPDKTTNQPGQTLYITKDDRVGIDRASPQAKLHIGNNGPQWTTNGWRKALKLGTGNGNGALQFTNSGSGTKHFGLGGSTNDRFYGWYTSTDGSSGDAAHYWLIVDGGYDGNVGIGGNPSSSEKFTVHGTNTLGAGIANSHFPWSGNGWAYVSGKGIIFREDAAGNYAERMRIADNGNVGIGTTNTSSYKLSVNGKIRAKEVRVETNWSDFVFADDYDLMPLTELEEHIKENKHLPGIPTEKEVQKGGVELGVMQAKLLEKVEELTLYVIEQNNQLTEQNEKLNKLQKENEELRDIIYTLKTK